MKKLIISQISSVEVLTDEEMKNLLGGDNNSKCPKSGYSGRKFVACCTESGGFKSPGAQCSFTDTKGKTQYGTCQPWMGQPVHCSDLNYSLPHK